MQTEDLKLDRKDLKFKLKDFESGKSNVLLITGFVGSGKSTLADKLAKKYDAQHLQLDCFTEYLNGGETLEELENLEEFGLLDYIKEANLDKKVGQLDFDSDEVVYLIRDYLKFLIKWCEQQDEKFIIEGMSIYDVFQEGDDFITSCPMIIKGTSGETATKRAAKRNANFKAEHSQSDWTEQEWYDTLVQYIKADDEKLNVLEKEMNKTFAEEFKEYNELWD